MASIADLYKDENTASHDRLLSARVGSLNILQNQASESKSGWVAPAVSMALGQETAQTVEENSRKSKASEFMTSFTKMATVNGGAAVKLWNTHAEEALGTPVKIDKAERDVNKMKFSFDNGKIVILTPDGVQTVDDNGEYRPWSEDDSKQFQKNFELKNQKGGGSASQKEKRKQAYVKMYMDAEGGKSITADPYVMMKLKEGGWDAAKSRDEQLRIIEALWTQEGWNVNDLKQKPAPAAAPQAYTPGSVGIGSPTLGLGGMYGAGSSQAAPPPAPNKRPLPTFR